MADPTDLLLRLALDAAVVAALLYGIFLPRHRRMDLVVVYALFNAGVFLAITVITGGDVSLGVGLGLFAVLSMIRLRSETFSNRELAYFFVALVVALVCAVDFGGLAWTGMLTAVVLLVVWAVDHPRVSRPTHRLEVTLEMAIPDGVALRQNLEERLNCEVIDVRVLEVDYVREITRVAVYHTPRGARTPAILPHEVLDAQPSVVNR